MSCPETLDLIADAPLDLLEPAERARLDAHLASCDGCRAALAELEACLSAALPQATPPEQAWERLAARIAAERGVALKVVLSCSYCKDALARGESCYCAACLAPHHRDCFREHGRCSAPGCDETRMVEATPPRPARSAGPVLWVALGVGLATAAAVGSQRLFPSRLDPPGPTRVAVAEAPAALETGTAPWLAMHFAETKEQGCTDCHAPPQGHQAMADAIGVGGATDPPGLEGRVVSVETGMDPPELVLSIGSDDGVEKLDEFSIQNGSGQQVGRAVVETVRADSATLRLYLLREGKAVQPGDRAIRSKPVIERTARPEAETLEQAIRDGLESQRLKEYRNAFAACDRAERIDPRSPRPWTLRGHVHWDLREYGAARAAYDRALELAPDHVPALLARAQLRVLDDPAGALADATRAHQLDPDGDRVAETLENVRTQAEVGEKLRELEGMAEQMRRKRGDPAPVGSPSGQGRGGAGPPLLPESQWGTLPAAAAGQKFSIEARWGELFGESVILWRCEALRGHLVVRGGTPLQDRLARNRDSVNEPLVPRKSSVRLECVAIARGQGCVLQLERVFRLPDDVVQQREKLGAARDPEAIAALAAETKALAERWDDEALHALVQEMLDRAGR